MVESFEEYSGLAETGYTGGGREQVAPEDEFFHSVYIAGTSRKNHIGITEEAGKLQLRGVEYNLDEVHMVITHTKDILAKIISQNGRDNVECFSYKNTPSPPWYGTSKLPDGRNRPCPITSAERAVNDFCNSCRSQILIAGIYCNKDGVPVLKENKPIFVFIRGKGTKYSNVSEYLGSLYNEDLSPIFEPPTDQSKEFEKSVVNNKRFVTKITKGEANSRYGMKNVFVLEKGIELGKDNVLQILQLSKKTLDKFNEKFDWSAGRTTATGYGDQPPAQAEGVLDFDSPEGSKEAEESGESEKPQETPQDGKTFSFDDMEF